MVPSDSYLLVFMPLCHLLPFSVGWALVTHFELIEYTKVTRCHF